jgi:hypothetical protein
LIDRIAELRENKRLKELQEREEEDKKNVSFAAGINTLGTSKRNVMAGQ